MISIGHICLDFTVVEVCNASVSYAIARLVVSDKDATALQKRRACNVPVGRWKKGAGNVQKAHIGSIVFVDFTVSKVRNAINVSTTSSSILHKSREVSRSSGALEDKCRKVQKGSAHGYRSIIQDFTCVKVCDTAVGDQDAPALPKQNAST